MTDNASNGRGSGTTANTAVCAAVFCVLTFSYLCFYQADLLAMEQHVLSHGLTTYNDVGGAFLVTTLLQLLQMAIDFLTHRRVRLHALTYMPSVLLLAALTDVSQHVDEGYSLCKWALLLPVGLVVSAALMYAFANMPSSDTEDAGHPTALRTVADNLGVMVLMFTGMCLTANTSRVFHTRMRMERLISEGRYDDALRAESRIPDADSSLTMLRALALSKEGQLGNRLFEARLKGGSDALLPNGVTVKAMLLGDTAVYRHISSLPVFTIRPIELLRQQCRRHPHSAARDYLLCAFLLDRRIDDFARLIGRSDSASLAGLPKHYREALVLYNHLRSNPLVVFRDPLMEADYADLQQILRTYSTPEERRFYARRQYGTTYWYYYLLE